MEILKTVHIASISVAALVLLGAPSGAVTVPGSANPFLAGQPDGATCCTDSAPAQSPVLALSGALGGTILTFSTSGGTNFTGGTPAPTADGFDTVNFNMDANNFGISGPLHVNASGLVGVFINDNVPSGPTAPAQRDDGLAFTSISPLLNQIFLDR